MDRCVVCFAEVPKSTLRRRLNSDSTRHVIPTLQDVVSRSMSLNLPSTDDTFLRLSSVFPKNREAYSAEKGSDRTRSGAFCVYETIWRDPADRVHMHRHLEGRHSKVICQHRLANTQTRHSLPKKLLTARSWSGLTWPAVSQFGGCQRDKCFVRLSCLVRVLCSMLPVNHVTSPRITRSLQSDWLCWDFGREHDFLWRVTRPSLPVYFRCTPHPNYCLVEGLARETSDL